MEIVTLTCAPLFVLPTCSYDALLGAGSDWIEMCKRGVLHYGDSDSTGVIAGACFGAMYGFEGVPDRNYVVSLALKLKAIMI